MTTITENTKPFFQFPSDHEVTQRSRSENLISHLDKTIFMKSHEQGHNTRVIKSRTEEMHVCRRQ